MSEPRLISPMLDNFMMGGPISNHHGVCCCPAMENDTNDKYIVKVVSVPASPTQMDALLLSGAFSDETAALNYYREIADEVVKEIDILEKLAELEWFIPYKAHQLVPMESGKGYEIYLLGQYRRTLQKHFTRHIFTHLDALNLGLDLCSALSMCRRNGYLYVDLKPGNIFVADQRLFRIGDLGFVSLDSLKYASLPEKYQSIYTAPEVRDAFSALNTTMDIYAAGLILYQTYNNGELPFNDDIQPGDTLPAPLYADYEIGEIILKACAPNPDDRWQDPIEMRQAIINYMQRNGAMDTPIVPMPSQEETEQNVQSEIEEPLPEPETNVEVDEQICVPSKSEENIQQESEEVQEEILESTADIENNETDSNVGVTEEGEEREEIPESDREIAEDIFPEEDSELDDEIEDLSVDSAELTEEVSEMLSQADELVAHDVPDPVVVPDHVDIPMPEPIEPAADESEKNDSDSEESDESLLIDTETQENVYDPILVKSTGKHFHWIRNAIIIFGVIALLICGFYYYKNHYLLPIEYIAVNGNRDSLTVMVTADIDESLLQVICSDTYGNKIPAPVVDGKAEFTGLVPNTAYSIKVVAKGFHRLTGSASTAYSTPIQTNIVQFDAISGSTEDSVILSFTAEGPDSTEWTVEYSAEGEETRTATFVDSNMVTITNLTVGKAYTFTLTPKQDLYLTGQSQITFTPRQLVRAEKVEVTGCINNTLTVTWSAPEGEEVSDWSIRCYNKDYSQTVVTSDTTVTFEGLDHTKEFHVEVKAVGMSISETITVPANSVTVTNFNLDTSDSTKLTLTWETSQPVPEEGWVLCYTVSGLGSEETVICKENSAVISSLIPESTYRIHIEDMKGTVLLGSYREITTDAAAAFQMPFNNFTLSAQDLTFYMVKTPSRSNWGRYDLADEDYTDTFSVGQSASFLVRASRSCYDSSVNTTVLFLIRDESGAPILTSQQTSVWSDMWKSYNCKLEISTMPTEPGTYSIEVYFNGGLAHQQTFTIQ